MGQNSLCITFYKNQEELEFLTEIEQPKSQNQRASKFPTSTQTKSKKIKLSQNYLSELTQS